jgi:diketogulonate reductase-like aldo/keto reductase
VKQGSPCQLSTKSKYIKSLTPHFFYVISHYVPSQLHPFCQQKPIVDYCKENGIVVQAFCPLLRGDFSNPVIQEVSKEVGSSFCCLNPLINVEIQHNKEPAQILVRWSIQRGWVSFVLSKFWMIR